jgi:hypothetical protein
MDSRPKRRSLTAWLESAAADRAEPLVEIESRPQIPPAPTGGPAPAEDRGRCTASVVSGQRCRRQAVEDGDLCAGHAAMAGPPSADR